MHVTKLGSGPPGPGCPGVMLAYGQGVAADELFSQLREEEFQQSGGLLPTPGPPLLEPGDGARGPEDGSEAGGGGSGLAAVGPEVRGWASGCQGGGGDKDCAGG